MHSKEDELIDKNDSYQGSDINHSSKKSITINSIIVDPEKVKKNKEKNKKSYIKFETPLKVGNKSLKLPLQDSSSFSESSQKEPEIIQLSSSSEEEKKYEDIDLKLPDSYKEAQKFLYNARLLNFNQVLANIKGAIFILQSLWRKKSCLNPFCGCLSSSDDLESNSEQEIYKLIHLGLATYDNGQQFHKDLFMSLYQKLTEKNEFRNTSEI